MHVPSALRRRWVAGVAACAVAVAGAGVWAAAAFAGTPGAWTEAWIAAPSSRTLMVRAIGQADPAGGCGPPQIRLSVAESATEVRVTARYLRMPHGPQACFAVGYGATPHPVGLAAPLGDRRVVDATTGRTHPVLDASTEATIGGLPSGYETVDLSRERGETSRQWKGPGGFVLMTTQPSPGRQHLVGGRIVRVGDIDVRLSAHGSRPRRVFDMEWRSRAGTLTFASLHLPTGTWTTEQALGTVERTTEATGSAGG